MNEEREQRSKRVWCVFGVFRESNALSYLGELHREKGTYTLKLQHPEATPWDEQRPFWIVSPRRMLATYAEAGIVDIPPATMTFFARPPGIPERNPLVLLGHVISSETIVLSHTPEVRKITKADYVIGHVRGA